MYRSTKVEVAGAADSTLTSPVFGPMKVFFDQVSDLQEFSTTIQIKPGAAEAQVPISPVTNGYFIALFSDYPVMVRLNGNASTQFTLKSNNVAVTNVGSPLPNMCCFVMSGTVTSLYLAPLSSATTTANVRVLVTGDPLNAYT